MLEVCVGGYVGNMRVWWGMLGVWGYVGSVCVGGMLGI